MRASLTVLVALWLNMAWAAEVSTLPKEVAGFLEQRESCDHWRGEEGYDEERQADINRAICQDCTGTDAELVRLKKKYSPNNKVMDKLGDIEPNIEPKDKTEAQRFCRKIRKPQ